eukprot:m.143475 g.143475  ORF g.143475 m.143475 type:complete len:70 (+) comp38393_c0_seq4:84-293(+)
MNCIVANINNFVKFHLLVSLHTLLCCGTRFHTVYCSISEAPHASESSGENRGEREEQLLPPVEAKLRCQ